MSKKDLQAEELIKLSEEEEIFNLESLITDGADARVPIEIKFPTKTGTKRAAAMIRPLTNVEWNNAIRIARKNFTTTNEIELLKIALYTKDGEPFPKELVEKIPNGVVIKLVQILSEISGIEITEENMKMAKEMLKGF